MSETDRTPRDPAKLPDYRCPVCYCTSELVISTRQAFCTADACRVLIFDPLRLDGGLSDAKVIDLDS